MPADAKMIDSTDIESVMIELRAELQRIVDEFSREFASLAEYAQQPLIEKQRLILSQLQLLLESLESAGNTYKNVTSEHVQDLAGLVAANRATLAGFDGVLRRMPDTLQEYLSKSMRPLLYEIITKQLDAVSERSFAVGKRKLVPVIGAAILATSVATAGLVRWLAPGNSTTMLSTEEYRLLAAGHMLDYVWPKLTPQEREKILRLSDKYNL